PAIRIDVIHGKVFLDGVAFERDGQSNTQVLRELSDLGIDSLRIHEGIDVDEIRRAAEYLWQIKEPNYTEPLEVELARRNITHLTVGRLVPLDTRWHAQQWPDAPTGPLDPDYAESLQLAEQTFAAVSAGRQLDLVTVRDLVQILIYKVAQS